MKFMKILLLSAFTFGLFSFSGEAFAAKKSSTIIGEPTTCTFDCQDEKGSWWLWWR